MKQEKDFIDLYTLYGFTDIPSDADLKKRYRELIRKYHPDLTTEPKNVAEEMSKKINYAWNILKDKKKKAEYDKVYLFFKQKKDTFSTNDTRSKQSYTTYSVKDVMNRYASCIAWWKDESDFIGSIWIEIIMLLFMIFFAALTVAPLFYIYKLNMLQIFIMLGGLPPWGLCLIIAGAIWAKHIKHFCWISYKTKRTPRNYYWSHLHPVIGWLVLLYVKNRTIIRKKAVLAATTGRGKYWMPVKNGWIILLGLLYSGTMTYLLIDKHEDIMLYYAESTTMLIIALGGILGLFKNDIEKFSEYKKQGL